MAETRTLCDTTEKIILSPRGSKDEGHWHMLSSHCSRREVGQPSENGVPLRNSVRNSFTGGLSHAAHVDRDSWGWAVRTRGWVALLLKVWKPPVSVTCSCLFKSQISGTTLHLWNHSLRMRPTNLSFEPIPQVMLMLTRLWELLWRNWTYALRENGQDSPPVTGPHKKWKDKNHHHH